ncbi:MAG: ABC transporter permease [Patescibacteria group bacterium]|nr:ABC transporter permease [Patescibacteria group bacterium]
MEIIISSQKRGIFQRFKEVISFKELLYFFIWRDVKVRYKQTFFGVLWVIIQPTLLVLIFSFIFSSLGDNNQSRIPYPVLAFIGIFFWLLFSNIITTVGNSLISNQHIIQKIYFPNILIPLASTAVSLFDALFMLVILVIVFLIYGIPFTGIFFLMLIFGLILTVVIGLGLGLFLGALNVKYRDVRYILPFFIQILFFLSPVIYTFRHVPRHFGRFLVFNPLTGIIDSVQSSLVGMKVIIWNEVYLAIIVSMAVLVIGFLTFNQLEREFSDII